LYPLIPWIGVMAAGYAFGLFYNIDPKVRSTRMAQLGTVLITLFLVLRAINEYGDPKPWFDPDTTWGGVMSFLNVTKYPPSLIYLCMTLGVAILLLAGLELLTQQRNHRWFFVERSLIMFGQVPLFYYVLQWFYTHGIAVIAGKLAGQDVTPLFHGPPFAGASASGFSLAAVYAMWAGGVILLYFPCRWYARVKREGNHWWLSYL